MGEYMTLRSFESSDEALYVYCIVYTVGRHDSVIKERGIWTGARPSSTVSYM